jgi:hypothetical protein
MGRAFYNPSNTALDIVGMSIRRRVSKNAQQTERPFRERVPEKPLHFRISQEH